MSTIKVGTKVQATFESLNDDSLTEAFGKVVAIKRFRRKSMDFVATVLWDDGSLFSMTALFFRQTVQVVDEVIV